MIDNNNFKYYVLMRTKHLVVHKSMIPLDIGRIKSFINLSSMASRPKSSRTAPNLFIVFGRMILNLVSCTHLSKFST